MKQQKSTLETDIPHKRSRLWSRLSIIFVALVSFAIGAGAIGFLSVREHFKATYRAHGFAAEDHIEILGMLRKGDIESAITRSEDEADRHARRSIWRPGRMPWQDRNLSPEELPPWTMAQLQETKAYFEKYPSKRLSSQMQEYFELLPKSSREGLKSEFANIYLGKDALPLSSSKWIGSSANGLEDLRGKVVLLEFWATDCAPCIKAMPKVENLCQTYRDKGFEAVGVHPPIDAAEVEMFLKDRNFSYLFCVDTGKTAVSYAVTSYPTYYIIDRSGKLVWGPSDELPTNAIVEEFLSN